MAHSNSRRWARRTFRKKGDAARLRSDSVYIREIIALSQGLLRFPFSFNGRRRLSERKRERGSGGSCLASPGFSRARTEDGDCLTAWTSFRHSRIHPANEDGDTRSVTHRPPSVAGTTTELFN